MQWALEKHDNIKLNVTNETPPPPAPPYVVRWFAYVEFHVVNRNACSNSSSSVQRAYMDGGGICAVH